MPRRSPQHHEQRREQVLAAALRCFARDGFHAASMADVIAAAGVSAGTVYRYFPSKSALVVAAGRAVFLPAAAPLTALVESGRVVRPTEAMGAMFAALLERAQRDSTDMTSLTLDVWAESQRDAEIRDALQQVYGGIRTDLGALAARWQEAGHIPASEDTDALTTALAGVMPGLLLQRRIFGEVDAAGALRALGERTGL